MHFILTVNNNEFSIKPHSGIRPLQTQAYMYTERGHAVHFSASMTEAELKHAKQMVDDYATILARMAASPVVMEAA